MRFVEVRGNTFYSMLMTIFSRCHQEAGLAQSVERQALNLMVEGSSPSFGVFLFWSRQYTGPESHKTQPTRHEDLHRCCLQRLLVDYGMTQSLLLIN